MDQWLTSIESAGAPGSASEEVVRNRPSEAESGRWIDGVRLDDLDRSDMAYPCFREPRSLAGVPLMLSTMTCQLEPLERSNSGAGLTDAQWAALRITFPRGVCDVPKPGVGCRPSVPWLTYSQGPGGRALGAPPVSQ